MRIFCFTKKGKDKKINTDTILFSSGSIISNPWIISEQSNYSHHIDKIEDISIAMVSDGLGSTFASKLAANVYNNDFLNAINLVGEQEIFYWISESFVRLELNASREASIDKNLETAGASIAGVFYHPYAGLFIFNAGDAKVFSSKKNVVSQMTREHVRDGVLENCACAGGGHYVSVEGGIRDKNASYLIATNSFSEVLIKKGLDINNTVNTILSMEKSEDSIKMLSDTTEDFYENISCIGLCI